MSLLDDVLAANAAVVAGATVPVPAVPYGRRVVVVTCSEIRAPGGRDLATYLGFARDEAFVVANAGARVHEVVGDVVRSVAAALSKAGGGEVFVVAHEDCAFLDADPDSITSLLASPPASMQAAVTELCGASFVSARNLAIASAATLRSSPFLPASAPVHALVFERGRGRLTSEGAGYGVGVGGGSLGAARSPSPFLVPAGPSGFGTAGPVTLFGSAPSSLMGAAPPPLLAPPPDLGGGGASFLAPPPPSVQSDFAAPSAAVGFASLPPGFVPPPPKPQKPSPSEPPPLEPLAFKDPVPPPPPRPSPFQPKPGAARSEDDPFRKAQETLERLRRQRKK